MDREQEIIKKEIEIRERRFKMYGFLAGSAIPLGITLGAFAETRMMHHHGDTGLSIALLTAVLGLVAGFAGGLVETRKIILLQGKLRPTPYNPRRV